MDCVAAGEGRLASRTMRLREVFPEENRWWPLDALIVGKVVPERFRGVYLIADSAGTPIYAGESPDLRNALRKHIEGESEEAACIRSASSRWTG